MAEIGRNERVLGPLKVGLRSDLHVTRQDTRGGPRYLVHDPISFQNHSFSAQDYHILTAIVRQRTLADTFLELVARGLLEDKDEDRQGFYKFVLWLHGTGLLHLPIGNGDLLYERQRKKQAMRRTRWTRFLMSFRIPLGNPDAFLSRSLRWSGWIFATPGLLVWLALMATVMWKCFGQFDQLFVESTRMLALRNLPILWCALIGLKAIHEFGHAYACRRFGAPVPEMGVVMVMMTPCAYVDASASWKLVRGQRIVVALAGMYVESFVAGIAALVWAGTLPGFAHDVAFNVVVLASIVTVLFNLNPLMKYDGYYVFSDLLGVFNLQQRATSFLGAWASHLALGTARPQDNFTRGERCLYMSYGPATVVYRVMLAFAITGLVMMQWPGAGMFLGALFVWMLMIQPILRLVNHLWNGQEQPALRTRGRVVALGLVVLVPFVAGFLPVSWSVTAPGILDPRTRESVRAPTNGFVTTLAAGNGAQVKPGDLLCVLRNPELEMRRVQLEGEHEAEAISLDTVELEDTTQAAMHRARLAHLRSGVEEIEKRQKAMSICAHVEGTITSSYDLDLEGRFLQQGEELFQLQSEHRYLRMVLTDEAVSRARLEIGTEARVRFTCEPEATMRAWVREIRASASRAEIPLALTMLGGGDVYVRPTEGHGTQADQPYLHVVLEVESVPMHARGAGLTARVLLPARVEVLGTWLQRRVLSFWNAWRMS
jgi:putative peptide zinc metalloprotease protein